MKKRPFLIFMSVVSLMVVAILGFIQSPQFAAVIKNVLAKRLPSDLGIEGDFSEFRVNLFPPGVSIRQPKLRLAKRNVLDLPEGSSVSADRLELRFRPFQMLSGNIRVNEVAIINGDVNLILSAQGSGRKEKKKGLKPEFHWDELLQVRAEAVSVENTKLHLELSGTSFAADLRAQYFRLSQWAGVGGMGFELNVDVSDVQATGLSNWVVPDAIGRVTGTLHVNALGLQMDRVQVDGKGFSAVASGSIKGNILQPKGLILDANAKLDGGISDILTVLRKKKDAIDADGTIDFNGKVRGNLEHLADTLKVDGVTEIIHARFAHWRADHVTAEAGWSFGVGSKAGEVDVRKVLVEARERPRVSPEQAGEGGKIEFGAFRLPLSFREPISVPLTLERAHIHWLAAPVLKDVYALEGRISGPITATFTPAGKKAPWAIQAKLGLSVSDFQLDNQRLGKVKPLKKVLAVQKFAIEGPVTIDPAAVTFGGVAVSLPHTHFNATGKIDFKSGYDLTATGPADMSDIGQIAENEIRGKGTLTTHVHGPTKRVFLDFDADLKDAEYLRLHFGDFKGRITWDDDPQKLLFTHVVADRGRTHYLVDGLLDLAPGVDTADLNVQIPRGDIQDFIQIFSVMTENLWWFPRSLNGDVKGNARVSGGLALDHLVVGTELVGGNWEYLGERFRQVNLRGGYDKGKYHLSDLHAIKQTGKIAGKISVDAESRMEWAFHTQDFTLSDIDHLARLDVPFRGKLQIDSSGAGRLGSILGQTEASLDQVAVRGQPLPPSQGSIHTENGVATVKGSVGGGMGLLDMTYDFRDGAESSVRAELKHFDFSPILLLLNSRSMQDPALQGLASGLVQLKFRTGEADRASGRVEVSEYALAKTGARFDLLHPVSFRLTDGSFDLRDLGVRAGNNEATLWLTSRKGELNGGITGDLDLSIAQFLTAAISGSHGAASLDYSISGTLRAPKIFGKATIDGGSVKVASLDSPFENVSGVLQLRQNVLTVQSLVSDLSGGRVAMDGTITIFPDHYPEIALHGTISGSKIRVFPLQYAKVRGTLNVSGSDRPYLVSGNVSVDQAVSHEKVFNRQQTEGLKAIQYTPPPTAQREGSIPLFRLKIDSVADRGIVVQNDLFDAEAKGRLQIIGTLETPRVLGSAEIVQGRMVFKDRVFQIGSANASFDNPTVIDPVINLTANTEVSNTKIQIVVSGRMSNMKIDLTSNPAMPESDILSMLALGATGSETKRFYSATADTSAAQQGEAASLLLHSLDFNREVQNKTGLEIQLDESVNTLQAQSLFSNRGTADTTTPSPKIVIKRKLTKKLSVSYGSTVGVGTNKQNEANAELQVTPSFSVIGVWDYFETTDTKNTQTSYGADLKLQKRFK